MGWRRHTPFLSRPLCVFNSIRGRGYFCLDPSVCLTVYEVVLLLSGPLCVFNSIRGRGYFCLGPFVCLTVYEVVIILSGSLCVFSWVLFSLHIWPALFTASSKLRLMINVIYIYNVFSLYSIVTVINVLSVTHCSLRPVKLRMLYSSNSSPWKMNKT